MVLMLDDGCLRSRVDLVWLAKSGAVGLGYYGSVIYYTEDRPATAPTKDEDPYWSTPEDPSGYDFP